MSQEQLNRMDAFVQEEVDQWTVYLEQRLRAGVARRGIVVSGEYLRSIAASAARKGLQQAEAELRFATQGRFADMGAGWGYHKGQYILNAEQKREALKGRKGNKVYSKVAYGTLSTLMNNLANKYVEEIPELIQQAANDGR
ncbi:MAG: hypothetical protein JNL05_00445 [Flavobacteriales bacterium]|nr:hypothetical protein [Flavobacteriales bacterium]